MNTIATYIFLGGYIAAALPLIVLARYLWGSWQRDNQDVSVLGRTIFFLTIAQLIFYTSQFVTVFLGLLGLGESSRILIILMIDGSLVLMAALNWYSYAVVRKIHKNGTK